MLATWRIILLAIYVSAPVVAGGIAILAAMRKRRVFLYSYCMTCVTAIVLATGMSLVYAQAVQGTVIINQVLLGTYLAGSLLFVLKGLDWLMQRGLIKLLRPSKKRPARAMSCIVIRASLLAVLGLPYVMAVIMTFRPKVGPGGVPSQSFTRVEFVAADGTNLVGWWIPARPQPATRKNTPENWGHDTVIICHGLGSNKWNAMPMAGGCGEAGYNLLVFDFRAHGESGGQLTTYGMLEKQDVLAAVRWVKSTHPDQSIKVYGVGASMGAAALVSAAGDDSPTGRAIDAVVVFGTYARLDELVHEVCNNYFPSPLNTLAYRLGLPIAEAHVGEDLSAFAPADAISKIWPRPVLVIHGMKDEIIPFSQGQELFMAASPPRLHIWKPEGTHNDVVQDAGLADQVVKFLQTSGKTPVI